MTIEVEFISKELIKPSFPTPDHLSKLHFSFIDQINYPVPIPLTFFYKKSDTLSNKQRSNLLKQALSKALTIFYPLAGRINNNSYADCNDQGATFIEAKANCQLSDILENRNQYHSHRHKFIPLQPQQGVHLYGTLIQVTYFECGGSAITLAMPHKLGDGLSNFIFLNCWAAVARDDTAYLKNTNIPPMGSSSIFPPATVSGSDIIPLESKEKKIITKPFVFDALTLSALRDEYSGNNGEKLSRVQALSAFMFSQVRASLKGNSNKWSAVLNTINMRPLIVDTDPPVSKQSFGNYFWVVVALIDKEDGCREIGRKIKDSFKSSVNSETIKKLQSDGQQLELLKETYGEVASKEIGKFTVSSLCNFPIYEIDFGWGEPEWVTTCAMILENVLAVFFDTKHGRGIEAWITMTEEDMAEFEKDSKLLLLAHNGKQIFNSRL